MITKYIIWFMGLCLVALIGFIIYSERNNKGDPTNRAIFIHRTPQYSDGHAVGVIDSMKVGESRTEFIFTPRDINIPKELSKSNKLGLGDKIKVKSYPLYFDNMQIKSYSSWSSHTNIIVANPSDIEKLPAEIREKNPEIVEEINKNNEMKDRVEIYKERLNSLKTIALEIGSATPERNVISKYKEAMEDLSPEIRRNETKDKK